MPANETPQRDDSPAARCSTLVLGLGNILLRDEGIGVRVAQALEGVPLPPDVEVVDGATAGFGLLGLLANRRKVIVIDAIMADEQPGTVLRLSPEDLLPPPGQSLSLHDVGLLEALAAARQLGESPHEVVIFGVQPQVIECGLELSPALAGLVPRIIELVLAELDSVASSQPSAS